MNMFDFGTLCLVVKTATLKDPISMKLRGKLRIIRLCNSCLVLQNNCHHIALSKLKQYYVTFNEKFSLDWKIQVDGIPFYAY